MKNRSIARKSVVAAGPIECGQILTADKLTVKRPGTGLSPMEWDKVIGTRARKSFREDDLIEI
jgi:N,N'-diacetyllegionaminate synthase